MQVCQEVSNSADAIREKSYHDGKRMGDQITVGQRGIAERIVGDHLSWLASAVAGGESPEAAYARLSQGLRQAIERFNVGKEYEVWRSPEAFGQQTLQFAFWKLSEASNA